MTNDAPCSWCNGSGFRGPSPCTECCSTGRTDAPACTCGSPTPTPTQHRFFCPWRSWWLQHRRDLLGARSQESYVYGGAQVESRQFTYAGPMEVRTLVVTSKLHHTIVVDHDFVEGVLYVRVEPVP